MGYSPMIPDMGGSSSALKYEKINVNDTYTFTVDKNVSNFIVAINLWNTDSYRAFYTVKINNVAYEDWKNNVIMIGTKSSTGATNSGYSSWIAVCNRSLSVGDTITLIDTQGASGASGIGIIY